jgi:uncharacterized protein (DUF736 family)
MENKVNTGVLFKNTNKKAENHPDYKGKGNSFGKEVEIAAWIKQGKNGSFLSLSFSEPYVAPVSEPITQVNNDDFPF